MMTSDVTPSATPPASQKYKHASAKETITLLPCCKWFCSWKVMTGIDVWCGLARLSVWSSLSFDVLLLFVWEERDWSDKCWGQQQQPKQQLNNKDICKGPLKEKFVNLISQLKQKLSASIIHKDKGRTNSEVTVYNFFLSLEQENR